MDIINNSTCHNKNHSRDFFKTSKKKIHKLHCHSCGYFYVQDTKRDWYGAELKILAEIHKKIFKDHRITITEIDDQELQRIISDRRLQIAAKRKENLAAVTECMKDLSKLERGSLEALWEEYSS